MPKNVNARVFTNQMWTDGQTTDKDDPKTSLEQYVSLKVCFSRVLLGKLPHPPWRPYFLDRSGPFSNSSEIYIKPMAKNVTSRVFTSCFLYKYKENTPPPCSHVFQRTETIFELNSRF
ncbi:hypothetical protein DPMN_047925 [Dreissena polymorpha]|uniref:Uncharacterized protein n=1 Tax=Dreissena polymorpha TaxID=45954 RepID=A0A9D4HZL6_DREPO|nr:hypothetical protein DPMN_047925 [Dreissena polymorpha]